MPTREDIIRAVEDSIRERWGVQMCTEYVLNVFARSGHPIEGITGTAEFLPRDVRVDCVHTEKTLPSDPIAFPPFTAGDIVVFYRFEYTPISHVMIARDAHTLVGTNNFSTFGRGSGELESFHINDTTHLELANCINLIRAVSPDEFMRYHLSRRR